VGALVESLSGQRIALAVTILDEHAKSIKRAHRRSNTKVALRITVRRVPREEWPLPICAPPNYRAPDVVLRVDVE
jgi:hypothetical protein